MINPWLIVVFVGGLISLAGILSLALRWAPRNGWARSNPRRFGAAMLLFGGAVVSTSLFSFGARGPAWDLVSLIIPVAFFLSALVVVVSTPRG